MEETAYFDTDNKIVVVRGTGEVTTENVKTGAKRALELSHQHKSNLLLFDIRSCGEAQPLSQGFKTMQNMTLTLGLSIAHKCAIVYDPEKYPSERAQFIEDVVRNRPNPAMKMFTAVDEAVDWLKRINV